MKRSISVFAALLLLSGCASRQPLPDIAFDTPVAPVATNTPSRPIPAPTASASKSRNGRPIAATTYGSGPRRIYLIASIHGDESEGRSATDELERHLASAAGNATIRLVNDMNPDGSAKKTRTNASGVDLNRNWPASNFKAAKSHGKSPLSEPETAAIHADITAFDPHVIIVLHSARGGPFVNFDGPASAAALADRFASAARKSDSRWRTVADMGYPTPGSMGSYFGKDRQLPILTIEFRRGDAASKIPKPLIAGVSAIAADSTVALMPLSQTGSKRVAHR
jgi:murein peptide amidase A